MRTRTVLAAILCAASATASGAAQYSFSSSGWASPFASPEDPAPNVSFTGSFEGVDLNDDNQISALDGEVTNFQANFTGEPLDIITSFSGPDSVNGLVLTLDGRGTLGDDFFGSIEGLSIGNNDFVIELGPGPLGFPCTGRGPCGGIFQAAGYEGGGFGGGGEFPVASTTESAGGGDFLVEIPIFPFPANPLAVTSEPITITQGPLGDLGEEGNPFLPNFTDPETGGFVFDVPGGFGPGEIFFIDPEIATGYTYQVTGGNKFLSVKLPTLATVPDGDADYSITVNGFTTSGFDPGSTVFFDPTDDITEFTITGIDPDLMLDPTDPLAFVTGVSVDLPGVGQITQTPITIMAPVPLPAGGVLLFTGLAGLAVWRRRRG